MLSQSRLFFLALLFTVPGFSAEQCPVNKISLARGLSCEVLQLLNRYNKDEPTIDAICLKLGRVSAILRRTQKQLPEFPEAPIPPTSFLTRAIEIEGFCGVGDDKTLPRGLRNVEFLVQEPNGFKQYMNDRLREQNKFIEKNQDVKGCEAPRPLKSDQEEECKGSVDDLASLIRHSKETSDSRPVHR